MFSNALSLIRPHDLTVATQILYLDVLTQSHRKAPVARAVAQLQAPRVK